MSAPGQTQVSSLRHEDTLTNSLLQSIVWSFTFKKGHFFLFVWTNRILIKYSLRKAHLQA